MESPLEKQYYPTIKQAIRLLLKLILLSLPLAIPIVVIGLLMEYIEIDKSLTDELLFLTSYIVLFVIAIKIGLKRFRLANESNFKLRFKPVSVSVIFLSILVLLAIIFISEPLDSLIPMPDSIKAYFEKMLQPNMISFISIAIAAPILEELLFRGIILEGFLRNYSPQKAIIWSAALFGAFHLNPWQAFGATIFGLFVGWLYLKTNSLIPGIILHFVNNFLVFCLAFGVDTSAETFYQLIDNWLIYTVVFILSIAICLFGIGIIKKRLNYTEVN